VLVSAGTYVESVPLTKSGVKGKPITLKAKPGETAIWRSKNTDTNSENGALSIRKQSFLRIEGFTFDGSTTRSTIYVWNDPRNKEVAPVQGIEIVNNKFTNNGHNTNDARVVYFVSAGHKTFDSGDVQNVISGNTFSGNYGRNISLLATSDTLVSKNTATNGRGSLMGGGAYSARFLQIGGEDKEGNNSVRNIAEQNTIHDFTVQPYVGNAANGIQGIKLDSNADKNVIRNNTIYNLDAARRKDSEGIFLESRCDDNLVSGNVVYNIGQTAYRDGSKGTTTALRNQWVNNVGYNSQCGLSLSNAKGAVVQNNIFAHNTDAQVYVAEMSAANGGHTFSHNLYHRAEAGKLNAWNGSATSCKAATHDFSSWTSASKDKNSLAADPRFENPPSDFRLKSTSPAIDAGVAGVDMGAYPNDESIPVLLSAPTGLRVIQ
ncbi:MAG: right-handed parallel beta-helix repeat-containing protein, partial [Thermodesulfobacteriota bacterium]